MSKSGVSSLFKTYRGLIIAHHKTFLKFYGHKSTDFTQKTRVLVCYVSIPTGSTINSDRNSAKPFGL